MKIGEYFGGVLRAMVGDNQNRDPLSDFWYNAVTVMSAAGVAVTAEAAVRVPAFAACLQAYAKPVGSLPAIVFRLNADGSKTKLPDHPVARLLFDGPNDEDTGLEWRSQMEWDLRLYRNAYSEILPQFGAGDTFFSGLVRIHPTLVTVERNKATREIEYRVRDQFSGAQRILYKDQVFHLKSFPYTADGLTGVPMIESGTGRDVIGQAIALQEFTSRFFAHDTQSGGIIEGMTFKDDPSRENFKRALIQARAGRNAWKTLILDMGGKYVANPIDAEKSQLIETRKQLAIELAQICDVPPHVVGLLDKATNNNIEQQSLEWVLHKLGPDFVNWEHRLKKDLILEPDVFVEFNVVSLLRGAIKERYEAFAIARNWGWLSVNDIRRLENMDPVDDGDTYLQPLNMTPAGGESIPAPGPVKQIEAPPPGPEKDPADEETGEAETGAQARAAAFSSTMARVVSISGRRLHRALARA